MRTIVAIICLIALAGDATAQKDVRPPAALAGSTINRTVWAPANGFIRLFQLTGDIRVQGWDRDSIAVTGTVNIPANGEFTITPGKQGVKVSLWGPDETQARPSQLLIRVPRRSQLWIKTQSADVAVRDFEGGLDVVTVSGDIEVAAKPREIYIETMGGSANLALHSRSARVKTGTGQVTLRGTIDDATVSTVSGAVFALQTQLRQARFESLEGRISFTGELLEPAALEFINHAGDVELALSPGSAAQFSITTLQGYFRDEWGLNTTSFAGKLEGKEIGFQLGSEPVADVIIRSFRGAVILKKK